ncbi:MAG: hypothetical protein WCG06_01965 [Candidatus Omnitrophota bacterium]
MEKSFKKLSLAFDIVSIYILAAFTLHLFGKYLPMPISHDESYFVWEGWNFLKGETPYVDFLLKSPVLMFLNAMGIFLFGLKDFHFRIAVLCMVLPSVVLLYLALRRLGVYGLFAFIVVLHYVTVFFRPSFHDSSINDSEAYAAALAVIGLAMILWNSRGIQKPFQWTIFVSGFFLALAVLTKEPFVFSGIAIVAVFFIFHRMSRSNYFGWHLPTVVVGGLTAGLFVFGYLAIRGSFFGYFEAMQINRIYAKYYVTDLFGIRFNSIAQMITYDLQKLHANYYNSPILFPLFPFYAAFLWKYRLSFFTLVNVIGVLLGAYGISMGHFHATHYQLIGTVGLLLPAIYGALWLSDFLKGKDIKYLWLMVPFVVLCVISIGQCAQMAKQGIPKCAWYSYQFPENLRDPVKRFTGKNDYILLLENPMMYIFLERKHSFRWGLLLDELIRGYPGDTEQEKMRLVREEIEKKLPKLIYAPPTSQFWARQQKHLEGVVFPIIRKYGYTDLGDGIYVLKDKS